MNDADTVNESITTEADGPETVNERLTTGGPGPEGQEDTVHEILSGAPASDEPEDVPEPEGEPVADEDPAAEVEG